MKKYAFDYIRFGQKNDFIYNDQNNRKIVRITENIDTLNPTCNCFENKKFIDTKVGMEAIEWLLEEVTI